MASALFTHHVTWIFSNIPSSAITKSYNTSAGFPSMILFPCTRCFHFINCADGTLISQKLASLFQRSTKQPTSHCTVDDTNLRDFFPVLYPNEGLQV